MDTVIVSCRTLETELELARRQTGVRCPVRYLESGLHNTPAKLNARLTELFSELTADRVLLAMGYCGNAVSGLRAGDFELIVPRADDCITLLLGSHARRMRTGKELAAYFLTEGWLRGERNIWTEYRYTMEKYGEEVGRMITDTLFSTYRTLALLDTGAEPVQPLVEKTRVIADTLHLRQEIVSGSLAYLRELLTGPWPETRFLRVPPGGEIAAAELTRFCD